MGSDLALRTLVTRPRLDSACPVSGVPYHDPGVGIVGTVVSMRVGGGVARLHAEPAGYEQGGWIASGSVTLPDGEVAVVGSVHAPPLRVEVRQLGGLDRVAIRLPPYRVPRSFDVVYATFRDRVQGRRFIVGGDWNVSPGLWTLLHPGSRDALFFDRARHDGWVDCYRRDHRHEGRTWYRDGDLPYQFDHVFCDPRTAGLVRACEIDPHPSTALRERKPRDPPGAACSGQRPAPSSRRQRAISRTHLTSVAPIAVQSFWGFPPPARQEGQGQRRREPVR